MLKTDDKRVAEKKKFNQLIKLFNDNWGMNDIVPLVDSFPDNWLDIPSTVLEATSTTFSIAFESKT